MADKFTYHLTNGGTLDLEGDTPPSDEEVEAIAKEQGVQLQPSDSQPTEVATTITKEPTEPVVDRELEPEEENSLLAGMKNVWDKSTEPLIHLGPETEAALSSYQQEHPVLGAIGNTAVNTMLGLTSPLNIAASAVGLGELGALKAGLPKIAQGLSYGTKALSAPVAAEGGINLLNPNSTIPERIGGGLELIAGVAGMKHKLPEIVDSDISSITHSTRDSTTKPKLRLEQDGSLINKDTGEVVYSKDSNFNAGDGDPMLAGAQPYPPLQPSADVRPQFNPKKQIGMTGSQQAAKSPKVDTAPKIDPRTQLLLDKRSEMPPTVAEDKTGKLQKIWDLSRGLMSVDLPFTTSAAFRQSSPLVGTKPWFEAWVDSAKSYGSKAAHEASQAAIESRPLFQPIKSANSKVASFAEEAGLRLSDLGKYTKREEALRGEWAEKIPIYGKHVAASNRAYTSFLNNVRADTFENLITAATEQGLNPQNNIALAKEIAEFVNTATGIGKLGVEAGHKGINLEANSKLLANALFSPRKIASEMRMLNPSTYIMAEPFVRNQYVKALARRIGTWWTLAGLAELGGATVSKDPNSADFGKIKIGNTRLDPPGGLQQFLVLGHRMLPEWMGGGGITSTNSGRFTPFGKGLNPSTRGSTLEDFGANRLHPSARYIYDILNATEKDQFHVMDKTAQMALPMLANDLADIARSDPSLLPAIPAALLSSTGMGVQSYDKGSFGKPSFIPEKYDLNIGR